MGEERPAVPGRHTVEMGGVRKALIFDRCPWATAYNDKDAVAYLGAYGVVERWREWPPGKRDPRLMEALTVIASEHNRADSEKLNG